MLQFILVDDEKIMRDKERQLLNEVLFSANVEYDILEYSHLTDELKMVINNSNPKVYIMDIDLKSKVSGLDIGKYIRNYDWDSEIIYITSHDKMFEKVFRNIYKVFDFIEKFDNLPDRLTEDLELILNKDYDNAMFTFKNNQVNLKLFLKDILYISRDTVERKLIIKTTHNAFKINKTLEEMLTELDERFEQVHRSCIVNTARVSKYNWSTGDFILDTSEKVPLLSKKYKEKVVK